MSIFPYSTEDKLFSSLFPHVSPPFLHNINTDGCPEPGAPQLLLALPLHHPAGFSHVHIAIALDFVTHVTAACWYHTAAPACCPPCFHITQREQRHCEHRRVLGAERKDSHGHAVHVKTATTFLHKMVPGLFENCVSWCVGRINILRTSTWNHNRLRVKHCSNLRSDTSHSWVYWHGNIPPSDTRSYVDRVTEGKAEASTLSEWKNSYFRQQTGPQCSFIDSIWAIKEQLSC